MNIDFLFELSSFLFFLIIGSWNMRQIFLVVKHKYYNTVLGMMQAGQLTHDEGKSKVVRAEFVTTTIWLLLTVYWGAVLVYRIWLRH